MKKILEYVKPYKLRILIGLLIKIVGTLMELAIPYILSYMIDELVPIGDMKKLLIFGGLMVLCSLIGFVGNVKANQMASYTAKGATQKLRHDMFEKVESLSPAQMDEVTVPSLISRMNNDTYNVHHMIAMIQRIGVRAPILLIGGLIVTLTLNAKLTLVLICVLPFIFCLSFFISKAGIPLYTNIQVAVDDMVRKIRENITGIRVIKALSKEDHEKESFAKVNKKVIDQELSTGYRMARLNPLVNLILNCGLVAVLVVGALLVMKGEIKAGKIIAFTSYFTIILNAMLSMSRIFEVLSRSIASARRIQYVFDLPKDLQIQDIEVQTTPYFIEFRNVNFSYNGKVNNLNNINFALKRGETLGIIGPTGAGKTAIINLLMRFYDIQDGEILIDGVNIKSIDDKELKKKFGACFQNDIIFNDTIRNNIAFNRTVSEEDLWKAIDIAQARDFVETRQGKLDFVLASKGTNISGGQKQRVLIARALVGNPEILVLDDSSSALDYRTDAMLRASIKESFKNTTQIIVAQRISSVMNCDHILMIDDGYQVGYGTHEDLMSSSQDYRDVYNLQMGDEVE